MNVLKIQRRSKKKKLPLSDNLLSLSFKKKFIAVVKTWKKIIGIINNIKSQGKGDEHKNSNHKIVY